MAGLQPSEFNIFTETLVGERWIAFNTLSGFIQVLSGEEFESIHATLSLAEGIDETQCPQWALKGGFVVDPSFDERREVIRRYELKSEAEGHVQLTVATTVNCNFGCTYCFQEHPNRNLDDSDMRAIQLYVERELQPGKGLTVTWFGGEPLLNLRAIKTLDAHFTALTEERGCSYHQSMITNGSLLREETIDYLSTLKNLSHLQITLDGLGADHDRKRPFRGGQPTFELILGNIERAVERLPISIRVNVDRANQDAVFPLADELASRGVLPRAMIYLGHVRAYTDVCASAATTALSRQEFADLEVRLRQYLLQKGIRMSGHLPKPRRGAICTADSSGGVVFSPGKLAFGCWNEAAMDEDAALGLLDENGELRPNEQSTSPDWKSYTPFQHEPCKTCKVQPLCMGGCPWESRKNDPAETGDCTTLRFNIKDQLKLFHLESVLFDALQDGETGKERAGVV